MWILAPVLWYFVCELILHIIRPPGSMPSGFSFGVQMAQMAGTAVLAIAAFVLVVFA